jgi:hypothetical protein
MRKVFYLGFCLVLMAGVGCAITDYQLITDNDQVITQQSANATVSTNGKAHIRSFQIALIFGDGADEIINFVDQKSNGDRTMTTYNNFSTFAGPGPTFHDDLYCNPDWQGCAIWTSNDPPGGYDRAGVGYNAFDGRYNVNCNGARSIIFLVGTQRQSRGYYNDGECGRGTQHNLSDLIQLMNMGQMGKYAGLSGMWFFLDQTNSTLMINGVNIPVVQTNVFAQFTGQGKLAMDLSNPLRQLTWNAASQVISGGDVFELDFIYNGITFHRQMKATPNFDTHVARRN